MLTTYPIGTWISSLRPAIWPISAGFHWLSAVFTLEHAYLSLSISGSPELESLAVRQTHCLSSSHSRRPWSSQRDAPAPAPESLSSHEILQFGPESGLRPLFLFFDTVAHYYAPLSGLGQSSLFAVSACCAKHLHAVPRKRQPWILGNVSENRFHTQMASFSTLRTQKSIHFDVVEIEARLSLRGRHGPKPASIPCAWTTSHRPRTTREHQTRPNSSRLRP